DAGLQPIRRIGQMTLGWRELGLLPVLRPLMVPRGAFGPDSPTADLVAAPSLRVLTDVGTEARFDALADLIARGEAIIRPDLRSVRYHVLSLDRPAAIMANGIWVEGFAGALATAIDDDAAGAFSLPRRGAADRHLAVLAR
ncbi:MAG: Hint domain-containing protein, partial [Albidovulum sp.]